MEREGLGIAITMGDGKYPWSGILDGWSNLDHQEFAARWLGMLLRVCVWDILMADINGRYVYGKSSRAGVKAPRQARRAARLMTIMTASKEASKGWESNSITYIIEKLYLSADFSFRMICQSLTQ